MPGTRVCLRRLPPGASGGSTAVHGEEVRVAVGAAAVRLTMPGRPCARRIRLAGDGLRAAAQHNVRSRISSHRRTPIRPGCRHSTPGTCTYTSSPGRYTALASPVPASGNIGTAVGAEIDHGQGVSAGTRVSYRDRGEALAAVERLAAGEDLAVVRRPRAPASPGRPVPARDSRPPPSHAARTTYAGPSRAARRPIRGRSGARPPPTDSGPQLLGADTRGRHRGRSPSRRPPGRTTSPARPGRATATRCGGRAGGGASGAARGSRRRRHTGQRPRCPQGGAGR